MPESVVRIILGILLSVLIALIAHRRGALSTSGAMATVVVGTIIFGIGGLLPALLLIAFFISSSLLSHLPTHGGGRAEHPKRTWKQVLANGGIPCLSMILLAIRPDLREEATLLFLGSLATSTADTWATEIGTRFGGIPRDLFTWKQRPVGESGGISAIGLLASAFGAIAIASLGLLQLPFSYSCQLQGLKAFPAVAFAGFVGALLDSALGSKFQLRYRCNVCANVVEVSNHCGLHANRISGIPVLGNNGVNLLSTTIGAIICIEFLAFLQ